jgi:hypothetical protein
MKMKGKRKIATNSVKGKIKKAKITAVPKDDITALILADHIPLKDAIKTLKDIEIGISKKRKLLNEFCHQLVIHAKAEEMSLYKRMLQHETDLRTEAFEGETEHHIAENLITEIESANDDDQWSAKVKVLAELVEHHIKEEESELLQDVRKGFVVDERIELGRDYMRLKEDLELEGSVSRTRGTSSSIMAS